MSVGHPSQLVLGQEAVDGISNEITAIAPLLEGIDVRARWRRSTPLDAIRTLLGVGPGGIMNYFRNRFHSAD
jgi:hypothetical protein